MNELGSIYIERNNCGDCYRCVRECAVKALKTVDHGVEIDNQRCVECAECVGKCKLGYIKMRNDTHLVRELIKSSQIKVASVSPSWISEFSGVEQSRLVEALKLLGFTYVSETALGAQAVIESETQMLKQWDGVAISSRCPAVVHYINKFRPKLSANIMPVISPMLAHAKMIKQWWGKDAKVVHICSCVSNKGEAERNPDLVEYVLTFRELKSWLVNEGIEFDKISGIDSYNFEPYVASRGLMYPLEGGAQEMMRGVGSQIVSIAKSSMESVVELLSVLPNKENEPIFLDLMACAEGCLGSCGASIYKESGVNRRMLFERVARARAASVQEYTLPEIDVMWGVQERTAPVANFVAESDTLKALDSLGISTEAQQIDCNWCGYGTCRRFAKALSKGVVKRDMCTHYVQFEMRSKFSTLINRLVAGVAVVDSDMKIVEANRQLTTMLGPDIELMYDAEPGLVGIDAGDVMPFSKLLASMLESGEQSAVRDIQVKEHIITVSVHSIQRYKLLLVICRNMLFSQVRNEEIVARTQKVIRENLDTVQKIAYLLGENASRTEAILNSILDSQALENDR